MLRQIFYKLHCYSFSVAKSDQLIFFGSGVVAFPTMKILAENYTNFKVVTHYNENKKKVFNEVEKYCIQHKIMYNTPVKDKKNKENRKIEWSNYVQSLNKPQIGVVCSFGYMLPKSLITKFQQGIIVVHPSLLPKYRGGSPIYHAIANGQKESGVSYIQISTSKFDQGNLLFQEKCQISQVDLYDKVTKQLADLAATKILHVLQNLDQLRPGISQDSLLEYLEDKSLVKAPVIKDTKISLNAPAQKIYNLARAIQKSVVMFKVLNETPKPVILRFLSEYLEGEGEVGIIKVVGKKLFVRCADKFIRVTHFFEPSRRESVIGLLIGQYIKNRGHQQKDITFQ